jgi:hypothetical protein
LPVGETERAAQQSETPTPDGAGVRQRDVVQFGQSSSPSLSESEFEFEFELLLELEFELELLLEFELLFELELELELELLFEFEFELLSEPHDAAVCIPFSASQASSSALTGAARNEVAMKATVATLAKVFIGGFLLFKKQPSVTAQG